MTRFMLLPRLMLASVVLFVAITSSVVCAQTIVPFDVPNATATIPQSNNLFGQITGIYQDSTFGVHGFLRQPNGSILTFDPPGSTETRATGINDLGQIAGYYLDDTTYHGFLRQRNGAITTFDATFISPDPDNPDVCEWRSEATMAQAINLAGEIAGIHRQRRVGITPEIGCAGIRFQGFLRDRNGSMSTFGISYYQFVGSQSLNLPGEITGYYQVADQGPQGGFLRHSDGTTTTFEVDPQNGKVPFTRANAINLFSQVAGFASIGTAIHGFLRQPNGRIVTFDPTGSTGTVATAVNDLGRITGYYLASDNANHGFVRKRNGAIITIDVPGAATSGQGGTFPQSINLFGQVTGYFQDENFVIHGFVRDK